MTTTAYDWRQRAKCVVDKTDPRIFDGVKVPGPDGTVKHNSRIDYSAALAICAQCPVDGFCLNDAIINDESDCVRGGKTPDEYRELAGNTRSLVRRKRPGEKGYRPSLAAAR